MTFQMTFQDALHNIRRIVRKEAEAEEIMIAAYRDLCGRRLTRIELLLMAKEICPEQTAQRSLKIAQTRADGIPLQHLTGTQVFLENEYAVGPDVLVPRPETELLVLAAIKELQGRVQSTPLFGIEIGIGSGAIAIELLVRFKNLRMIASELSDSAIKTAWENARKILGDGVNQRLQILQVPVETSVCDVFTQKADFLIGNPPYLKKDDPIENDVRLYEPSSALFAPGDDPLFFYRKIAEESRDLLFSNAKVFLEISEFRSTEIASCFESLGWNVKIETDLNQRDRILIAH